ncbi:MarR family winged helix-turn-helix transcriptional regulator [Streptacidiphilus anmyonensis]|uniref:MarR family winged helix-turn-helix transcriptional regulator n=1 Tax=Streptacidiphilus anmyonensis TaxID=405782 RepID=UPI0005AA91D0|nr:MarR family transcriptional regulator [Streptacidiphilus anmyonensis]
MDKPGTPGRPTELIEYEMMVLGRHVHMGSSSKRTSANLERSAYILLSRLQGEGPMSIGQLSDAFGLNASTLNRQTAALVGAGLAERIPDADGGMARKFRITEEGASRLEEARAELVSGLDKVLGGWAAEDVAAFADYLKRFNTSIEHIDGRPWPRP